MTIKKNITKFEMFVTKKVRLKNIITDDALFENIKKKVFRIT